MTVTCAHGAKAGEMCLLCHGVVENEEPFRYDHATDAKVREWEGSGKLPCPHGRWCYLWCPRCMGGF